MEEEHTWFHPKAGELSPGISDTLLGSVNSSVSVSLSVERAWLVGIGELKHSVATLSELGLAHSRHHSVSAADDGADVFGIQ